MPRPVPEPPSPGQESVWGYPRPPALRRCTKSIQVVLGGEVICATNLSWQVLETSHPPTYYLPRTAFAPGSLRRGAGSSVCEWKGAARYLDVLSGERIETSAAWYYPRPTAPFAPLADHVALYAHRMDACFVDGEQVRPQPGGFYGGWITADLAGPFKGGPGSLGW